MKVGKSSLARDMDAFIIACEDGTRALAGARKQVVKNWSDIRTLARFLKDPRMKEKYKALAVDTVDIAATLCEKYVCSSHDVQSLGEVPYGGGWTAFKKEFEDVFRGLTLEGYAVLFISHEKTKTITRPDGTTFDKTVPTVPDSICRIIENMADLIIYGYFDPTTKERMLQLRSLDGMSDAGSRFRYIQPLIPYGYDNLVNALNDAIDMEEQEHGADAVTDEATNRNTMTAALDFDALVKEFNEIVNSLFESAGQDKFTNFWQPRIVEITDKYLGTGKKVSQCSRNQAEQIDLIVGELKDVIETAAAQDNNVTE